MDMFKGVAEFIKEVGFPIFVAVYVLVRLEGTMKRLTGSILKLSDTMKGKI